MKAFRVFDKSLILINVKPSDDGCWIWQLSKFKTTGYGKFRGYVAHRASWMAFRGPIPEGLCVLHRCDVRACVNPAHLFLGTQQENLRDMTEKGRAVRDRGGLYRLDRTECRRGHRFTAATPTVTNRHGTRYKCPECATARIGGAA